MQEAVPARGFSAGLKTPIDWLAAHLRRVQWGDGVVGLHGLHAVEVHVEHEEDEAVEGRAQAVTQPPDARQHALCQAWGGRPERVEEEEEERDKGMNTGWSVQFS